MEHFGKMQKNVFNFYLHFSKFSGKKASRNGSEKTEKSKGITNSQVRQTPPHALCCIVPALKQHRSKKGVWKAAKHKQLPRDWTHIRVIISCVKSSCPAVWRQFPVQGCPGSHCPITSVWTLRAQLAGLVSSESRIQPR